MKKIFLVLIFIISSLVSNSQCAGEITFNLDIQPSADGTYPPGTVVTLCCEMNGWPGTSTGSNWLEGFGLSLGAGWVNVTPTQFPNDCNPSAGTTDQWLWVNNTTSSATGNSAGPGFFFEGPSGPLDGDPGNDYGDLGTDCIWQFCVQLTASNNPNDDLSLSLSAYSDGDMGSWSNTGCVGLDPPVVITPPGTIVGCIVYGCTNPDACNYNPLAGCDDGSCQLPGCTDPIACNYNINSLCDDGSCTYGGCTDPLACNFNEQAGCDDGSCGYFSMGEITHNLLPCPDTVCIGLNRLYSVTGNQNSIYDWHIDGPGSQLSTVVTDQSKDCLINWGDVPGTYTLSVQEITQQGCEGDVEFCQVEVVSPDIIFPNEPRICYNQSVILHAEPTGGYWTGNYVNGSTFIGYQPGDNFPKYTVNIYGCDYEESLLVYVEPLYEGPVISYSKLILDLCSDPSEQFYTAIDDRSVNYVWSIDNSRVLTGENVLNFTWYDTTSTYLLNVYGVDEIGCQSETSGINVHTDACQRLFAPNSFTPNGDGLNDIFKISGLSVNQPTLKIFDRWGIQIYTANNLWWTGDGGNGYYCNSDVYNWLVEYRDKNGTHQKESGFVTLIR